MIPDHDLRIAGVSSQKFKKLVENLDIIKMADIPPIDFSPLSEIERIDLLKWMEDDREEIPEIISTFVDKCK